MSPSFESPPTQRSEAFAEDVLDLVSASPAQNKPAGPARWLMHVLPVAVALLGVAFAVVPLLA